MNNQKTKLDFSITPPRLAVVIIGLALIALNAWFNDPFPGWILNGIFVGALFFVVSLTQPKK